jgi:hypothetical protein
MSLNSSATLRHIYWVKDTFGNTQPAWNTDPSLSVLQYIARKYLDIAVDVPCSVSPFAQGGFNKLYAVDTPGHTYLLRVALPVEPCLKTLSEAATIEFVRMYASDLLPRVLAYEADANSPEGSGLGFEWMMMEKLPGDVLKVCWDGIDWEAKVLLVKTLVCVLAKLYGQQLSGIGNIYPNATINHSLPLPAPYSQTVGRIVLMMFF